ncbi:phosphoglucosamine mutase [Nakamurella aerolata]|uniref:Phosphoglucosamine mutase n=1 Tax=Nakamurella aerolata TaxID=1656892 RepID=A0A849A5N7_9ACTN|nr:phosphoglucosamine mutase [Nakamurella aerolata]NNG35879.1 phosphoglucosamine mutase [Nakamurella aerolata]
MARLFGTDGVRGLANADLTPALALQLATSAARVLAHPGENGRAAAVSSGAETTGGAAAGAGPSTSSGAPARTRPLAVIGRDPRASGEMLEAAVAAGLASAGVDVALLGVLPTPAVAFLTNDMRADLGVVISASHNAMPDNGIKIFGAGGRKLSDEVEDAIQAGMQSTEPLPTGEGVGRIFTESDAVRRYSDHLLVSTPNGLSGLKIVVDCAHGASSTVAPEVYRRAGADVVVIAGEPNGLNINAGVGSTHLEGLQQAVVDTGADLGIAHDGDADRCLAVAADGTVIDGDVILALLAMSLHERGELNFGTVVTTVMANLGFHQAMRKAGIDVVTTAVGDRYVLAAMNSRGFSLGGEQSGHIVMADFATTGDGLLTALHLMARVASTGLPLGNLARIVTKFPQVLINVRVADKQQAADAPEVLAAVEQATAELGDQGRVLLRPSGTEPMIRVMVEAPTLDAAQGIADRVAAVVGGIGAVNS